MEFIKHLASSFRTVNRMGNEQSSQAAPEPVEENVVREKPWSLDQLTTSSESEDGRANQSNTLSKKSKTPPQSAQRARKNAGQERVRRSESAGIPSATNGQINASEEDRMQHTSVDKLQDTAKDTDTIVVASQSRSPRPRNAKKKNKFEKETSEGDGARSDAEHDNDIEGEAQETNVQIKTDQAATASNSQPLQIRSKGVNLRFRCPEANTYDCEKTFATERSARRHAEIHTNPQAFVCPVCFKTLSRLDKLKRHELVHSKSEIEQAIERIEDGQMPETTETIPHTDNENDKNDDDKDNDDDDNHEVVDGSQASIAAAFSVRAQEGSGSAPQSDSNDKGTTKSVEGSPAKTSASPLSEAGNPSNLPEVESTQRPKSRLKRKRNASEMADQSIMRAPHTSRKRRRRQSLSAPASESSEEDQSLQNRVPVANGVKRTPASKPTLVRPKSTKSGNLDNFAKPWTPGSELRHPIHNPRSPRVKSSQIVQVMVPRTIAGGPSKKPIKGGSNLPASIADRFDVEQTPLARKLIQSTYTSAKGKQRAENGIVYSSPPTQRKRSAGAVTLEPEGMATTIARKGSLLTNSQNQKGTHGGEDSEKPFVCQVCNRRFKTRDFLRKHEKRPNVHLFLNECGDCDETFPSMETLRDHQHEFGHGDGTGYEGRKGAFSTNEVRKLETWRDNFCMDNDIDVSTFNQMMTDSSRRTKGTRWPYRFITKADFLREYYDILPDRNRRSMHRYRERAFQNVPEKQEWTEEDDAELFQLVKELGPKWVEIGQRMTRTQDSVSQRWRFKVQHKGKVNQGEWLKSEEEKLKEAINQVKRESGLSLDPSAEVRISWDSVSKKLKGKRTAQQCSNKWRLLNSVRRGNKFVNPTEFDQSSAIETPSRMSQRLAGQISSARGPGSSSKQMLSEEYVYDSDNEGDEQDVEPEEVELDRQRTPNSETTMKRKRALPQSDFGSSNKYAALETPAPRKNLSQSRTTPAADGLSQVFAQTQANTSALRAPNTSRKAHTQTEMPTPGLPLQHRMSSSSFQAINMSSFDDRLSKQQDRNLDVDEDAVMADPEPSSEDLESNTSIKEGLVDGEASDTSSSGSDESSEADEEATEAGNDDDGIDVDDDHDEVDEQDTHSDSTSSAGSSSSSAGGSTDSSEEETEDASQVQETEKQAFLQSLRTSNGGDSAASTTNKLSQQRPSQGRARLESLLSNPQEADSDSEELEDIEYRSSM